MLKVFSRKGKDKSVKLPDVDEDGPAATPKSTVPDPMEQGAAKQAQLEAAARSGSSRAFAKYGAAKMTAQEQPEEITKLGSCAHARTRCGSLLLRGRCGCVGRCRRV
jgi:hypothetical protein